MLKRVRHRQVSQSARAVSIVTLAATLTATLVSCSFSANHSSHVLVIAVDQLAVSDVNCSRELKPAQKSGFDLLCRNSIRFTHAFTPSVMTLPALTSLMTGLYPIEHKVRNNGPDFLSTQVRSAALTAFTHNYRTSLFSGGAPVLRSSGLQQGFEIFDENINPTSKKIFRSADEVFRSYLAWSKETEGDQFSVLYLPDLLFIEKETVDEFGEPRNLSLESQIENLDANLSSLFSQMQKNHMWDSATIILVGLNGHSEDADHFKPEQNQWLNLHSSQTQVALFIKPPRKPRDEGLAWSFDPSVSLVDIGQTLLDIFEGSKSTHPADGRQNVALKRMSLTSTLEKPSEKLTDQTASGRWILSESTWGLWKNLFQLVYSLRKNDVLLIHDTRDHFFNTLTDKEETTEIPSTEPSLAADSAELQQLKTQLGLNDNLLPKGLSDNKRPLPVEQALRLVESNQWQQLAALAKKASKPDWAALAERNQSARKTFFTDPCLKLIDTKDASSGGDNSRKACNNRKILALFDEIQNNSATIKNKLLRIWKNELLFDRIMKSNFQLGEIWNLSESRQLEHLNFMLALNHPNAAKIRILLQRENL